MPCPFFLPGTRLGDFPCGVMPLGDCYSGECAAKSGVPIPVETLRSCCNRGYARGTCERAAQSEADAARFTIKADRDGFVEVAWSLERNHHPVAVGSMKFPRPENASDPMERQARAYLAAYLRKTGRA